MCNSLFQTHLVQQLCPIQLRFPLESYSTECLPQLRILGYSCHLPELGSGWAEDGDKDRQFPSSGPSRGCALRSEQDAAPGGSGRPGLPRLSMDRESQK